VYRYVKAFREKIKEMFSTKKSKGNYLSGSFSYKKLFGNFKIYEEGVKYVRKSQNWY